MDLRINIFESYLKSLRCGYSNGTVSTAKPILLISLLDFIPLCKANRFQVTDDRLTNIYKSNCSAYGNQCLTPINIPFFHLGSSPFYDLIWNSPDNRPPISHTPSAKYLRENLAYAKFDDDFWTLIQDSTVRDRFKQAIINQYLTAENFK